MGIRDLTEFCVEELGVFASSSLVVSTKRWTPPPDFDRLVSSRFQDLRPRVDMQVARLGPSMRAVHLEVIYQGTQSFFLSSISLAISWFLKFLVRSELVRGPPVGNFKILGTQ